MFENLECEWPLFFCYLVLDFLFRKDKERCREYMERLEEVLMNFFFFLFKHLFIFYVFARR